MEGRIVFRYNFLSLLFIVGRVITNSTVTVYGGTSI